MIRSTMQDYQLTIGAIMRHGARVYPGSECVTWTGSGTRRASYAQVAESAARLAGALTRLGIRPNDPVATFCWNNQEHLEAYFAVPSMGAVLHTLNIRLPGAQVAQIAGHAGDRIIIVDDTLVPLLGKVRGPAAHGGGVHRQRGRGRVRAGRPRPGVPLPRAARRRGARVRLARAGRARCRADVLHQRNHR